MAHEFNGQKYKQASTHQREWGTKLIAELRWLGSEHVLDLGCGDGSLTAQIAEVVPHGKVVGIDASQGMIDAARSKEQMNLMFQRIDINDLDFLEQFDVVFSNAALHWIKDHIRLLQNVYQALRNGGRLRFNFAADGNCSNFNNVMREAMARAQYSCFFANFDWPFYMPRIDEYQVLIRSSEFREVQIWGENADRYFPNEEAMVRWIDTPSIVPFVAQVAEDDKKSFRDFVVHRMIETTRQKDGRCFETFRRINVSAVK